MTVLAEKDGGVLRNLGTARHSIPKGHACSELSETRLKILLVSLLFLVVLLLQFLLRDIDNNRLLSWQWVMSQQDLLSVLLVSIVGFVIVYRFCFINIRENRAIIYVVTGSFLISIIAWPLPEYMVDSGRYFSHAKLISTYGLGYFLSEWGYGIDAWTDLPLASVIYGAAFYVFGESRLAIQIINTCLFSGSIFITYLLGKELWDAKVGNLAALLLLAIPFLHIQASQMLVDVPAMFFAILAIYFSLKAVKSYGNGWLLIASAAIVFSLLTKYSVWIALTSIAVLPFALKDRDKGEITKRLLLLALITAGLLTFVFYVHHPVILKQIKILLDYQLPAFQRWQESYASTFLFQIHPLVSVAALVSVYFAARKKDVAYLVPAVALAVMLLIGVYRARYLIIVFPMLALVAAYGILQIKDTLLRRYVVGGAVVVSLAITLLANINFLQQASSVNLQQAGEYLNSLNEESIAVVVLPQSATAVNPEVTLPILDYFTHKNLYQIKVQGSKQRVSNANRKISPLRFTWEVNHYPYPTTDITTLSSPSSSSAIVLISGDDGQAVLKQIEKLLAGYIKDKQFAVKDNVFRFQSIVTVYRPIHKGM